MAQTSDTAGSAPGETADKPTASSPSQPYEYKYDLSANVSMSDEQKGSFHEAMDTALTDRNAAAKKLLDLFADASQSRVRAVLAEENGRQREAFNDVCKAWRTQAMADPEIGGSGHRTAMAEVAPLLFWRNRRRPLQTSHLRTNWAWNWGWTKMTG